MSHKSKKKNPQSVSQGPGRAPKVAARPALTPAGGPALEDVEPQSDSAPVPVWLFVLLMVLIYWGMTHLDRSAGGFSDRVFGPYESDKQLADFQPKSGSEMLVAQGQAIYGQICFACHQPSGLGSPGQAPPLDGSEWVMGPPNRLIRIPIHGLTGPISVKGQTWNLQMTAFGGGPPLDNDQNLAAVLTYVRQAWSNKAPPITPAQVKAVRAEVTARVAPWTADELSKIP